MPMYFPDLKSIQELAKDMARHQEFGKKYKGIIPQSETELLQARKELAQYMREVWKDEIFAMEIELAVSEKDYDTKMAQGIKRQIITKAFNSLSKHEQDNLRMFDDLPF